ncbi:MAG: Photosystem I reaction center subunit III [Cyanobacteria bacterium P01_C01_bin.70]
MRKLLAILLAFFCWTIVASPAYAAAPDTHLIPCRESAAFQQRMQNAPNNYYFDEPYKAYSSHLLCGDDGLPHLQLRFDRAVDVIIPFAIFFYFAGFVGWSGRAYLISSKQSAKPEELEIFIDIPLAMRSFTQGLLWPLLAFQESTSGKLTNRNEELSVSPR